MVVESYNVVPISSYGFRQVVEGHRQVCVSFNHSNMPEPSQATLSNTFIIQASRVSSIKSSIEIPPQLLSLATKTGSFKMMTSSRSEVTTQK